jgi:thiamine-phosphate pyrophosphorylase
MLSEKNGTLRILDANANRAREALRVLEDYARFILNSSELCSLIKNLRHDLTTALEPWVWQAIIHRDTPGDVGTAIKTPTELSRTHLADVVTAAGKRAGESLRTIQEFLKLISSDQAAKIEELRYRVYDIEQRLSRTLRLQLRFDGAKLYVLITAARCQRPWLEAAELAIDGGADCLQLREKELPDAELLHRAMQLVQLCRSKGVLSIINDRPDIALLADADGVHLGQDDLPAIEARKIVGGKIVGVSTQNLAQAHQAHMDGADYIGVGPIFKSATKPRDFVAGLEYAAVAAKSISIPKIAIAGINLENVDDVLKTGIGAVAVTACVIGSTDIRAAARMMKEKLSSAPA